MKRLITLSFAFFCSAVALSGCGGGGGGGAAAPAAPATPAPTVATTKMYIFGTMSSATAGGSAGIVNNINTTISALPAGVTLTSIVHSGATATMPVVAGITPSTSFDGATRNLEINLLNTTDIDVKADTTSNSGKGIEVATLYFSLTGGTTPSIPTPGAATTVFQLRNINEINYLNGCVVNFVTTYQ